ncbi:methionine adenosyltransferase [Methylococcus sp. Mc7]|uniref:methionine adenosyltransferase n=1 Tax=Methylococcus sp. Mc7 TaxID=2860258 RepID=UPI001C5311F1|nr:methionine adenosyltransferase [Methylococcus sp. Mc7]QXP82662.1 methionine adenosyltransferase [Methylococcus sp. Mc7]
MKKTFLFTSEAVTEGHPDCVCDIISDAVVDRFLQQDPYARIVTECALSKSVIFLAARFASTAVVDIPELARRTIEDIGYHPEEFSAPESTVVTSFIVQSLEGRAERDEAEMTDKELDKLTVKNQVTQFGFACSQTPELLPLPIVLARRLARQLTGARRRGEVPYLSPDCTTQVGVEFDKGKPARIHSITLIAGTHGVPDLGVEELRGDLDKWVIAPAFEGEAVRPDENTEIFVNPRGMLHRSGPAAHSGMTGRKSASDTYGGYARHSGSALSGKGPLRIDRVAAYAARHAAKNVVAAGLAEECEVQLSYTIGQARPVSVQVSTFGTGSVGEDVIKQRLEKRFDFRLGAIVRDFNLRRLPSEYRGSFYRMLPAYGHFGASFTALPWERTDKADLLAGD